MLFISPSSSGSESSFSSTKSPFDSVDKDLFAGLFNQLSSGSEKADAIEQWLQDASEGEFDLAAIESDESLNQVLNWLKQQQETGKPLPPELNVEPEILEKAQSVLALLDQYAQVNHSTEMFEQAPQQKTRLQSELDLMVVKEEELQLRSPMKQEEPVKPEVSQELTLMDEAPYPAEPVFSLQHPPEQKTKIWLTDQQDKERLTVKQHQAVVEVKSQTEQSEKVVSSLNVLQQETSFVSQTQFQHEANTEVKTQPVSMADARGHEESAVWAEKNQIQTEGKTLITHLERTKSELEITPVKPELKDLSQQTTSLGGVTLTKAATLAGLPHEESPESQVKPQNRTASISPESSQSNQGMSPPQSMLRETGEVAVIELEGEDAANSEAKVPKSSSYFMPPPAEHQFRRKLTEVSERIPASKNELEQVSNRAQIQSMGGQALAPDQDGEGESHLKETQSSLPPVSQQKAASSETKQVETTQLELRKSQTDGLSEPFLRGEKTPVQQQAKEIQLESRHVAGTPSVPATAQSVGDFIEDESIEGQTKSAQGSTLAQGGETAVKEKLREPASISSAERTKAAATIESTQARAQASAQVNEQIEFDSHQELEVQIKSAEQSFSQDNFLREKQGRLNTLRRSLGGLAGAHAMTTSHEQVSPAQQGSTSATVQASTATAPTAEPTSFAQQLAQSQERLHILQEKMAPMLGQRLMMMMDQKVQQAEIQLDPPELGSLMVRVQVNQDNQAQVSFVAQNPQARDALEQALPRLKDMFQQQQMDLVNAEVSYQQREREGQQEQARSEHHPDQHESLEEMPEAALTSQQQQIILQAGKVDFYA